MDSQSIGKLNFELETNENNDTLYISNVREVDCTKDTCNKRISNAGQEWSAGRPGNRPLGARNAARNTDTCLGPYSTRAVVQSPHTGHNTREEDRALSRKPRPQDQDNTSQPRAISSRRQAIEDCASIAIAALHPRRLPYFTGAQDKDVHVWTSIVSRWLDTVWGEPSTQLTYVVSLLRGAAL